MELIIFINYIMICTYMLGFISYGMKCTYLSLFQAFLCFYLGIKQLDELIDVYNQRYNLTNTI